MASVSFGVPMTVWVLFSIGTAVADALSHQTSAFHLRDVQIPSAPNTTCGPCTVIQPSMQHVGWFTTTLFGTPYTTVTAAEIIYVVNPENNSTETITSTFPLPSGMTTPPPPQRDAQGTIVSTYTYRTEGLNVSTVITYPSTFQYWSPAYTWKGALETTNAANVSVCSSSSSNIVVPLPSSLTVPDATVAASSLFPDPSTQVLDSPYGDGYMIHGDTMWIIWPELERVLDKESAFNTCSGFAIGPESFVRTVSFLTKHRTVLVGAEGTTSNSGPTSNPLTEDPTSPVTTVRSKSSSSKATPAQTPTKTFVPTSGEGSSTSKGIPVGGTTIPATPTLIPSSIGGTKTKVPAIIIPIPTTINVQGANSVSTSLATLTPGDTITVDGTPVELMSSASVTLPKQITQVVIEGSQTTNLVPLTGSQGNSGLFVTNSDGSIVYESETSSVVLTPGESFTMGSGPKATTVMVTTDSEGHTILVGESYSTTFDAVSSSATELQGTSGGTSATNDLSPDASTSVTGHGGGSPTVQSSATQGSGLPENEAARSEVGWFGLGLSVLMGFLLAVNDI